MHLVRVQTSPNDRMLWALDSRCNAHVRIGITEEMPVGTAWEHIPGTTPLYFFSFILTLILFLICCHRNSHFINTVYIQVKINVLKINAAAALVLGC